MLASRAVKRDFPAESHVVVEIKSIEPCLDIFAGLGVLSDVLGETRKRFGIAVGPALFYVGGPGFDFPRRAGSLGVGLDPFEDFAVGFVFGQLLQECFQVESEKANQVSVDGIGVLMDLNVFGGLGMNS